MRRVIELATPHLLTQSDKKIVRVILLTGEEPDEIWLREFSDHCRPIPVEVICEPALGYFSEQTGSLTAISLVVKNTFNRLLTFSKDPLIWAHNLSLGRNWIVARELAERAGEGALQLVSHHHDWWFDQRWDRMLEMERAGIDSLTAIAEIPFPRSENVRHIAINQHDAQLLTRRIGNSAAWLPNPISAKSEAAANRHPSARDWLIEKIGEDAPVWLMPCRLLRRKNIAEALLLARWLRPEAWLVTTAGASSATEKDYASRLEQAAKRFGWKLRLGILDAKGASDPRVQMLMAVSEAVLMTSIQEGFGLPFLEAARAERPLIARRILRVTTDLENLGMRFPQLYDEVFVDAGLFDWRVECERQNLQRENLQKTIPSFCGELIEERWRLAESPPEKIAFSRLTLEAQIEVLSQPIERSWRMCAPLNPWLADWRRLAQDQALEATRIPSETEMTLCGERYAQRFFSWLANSNPSRTEFSPHDLLRDFLQDRERHDALFPLLWQDQNAKPKLR